MPTRDEQCVRFLQWALPRLGYRWPGFRKVRRQVCRRLERRRRELCLTDLGDYRRYLERESAEWRHVDAACRVTISRFGRGRRAWEVLARDVLPGLYLEAARRDPPALRAWSAGCGAGEEPYTLAILLREGPMPLPESLGVEIVGTDVDAHQLERARRRIYPASSLRDLPEAWKRRCFTEVGEDSLRLGPRWAEGVEFARQDLRRESPAGPFDLVLCRNLAFTYFDRPTQEACLRRILDASAPHAWLILGSHEALPAGKWPLTAHPPEPALVARTRASVAPWPTEAAAPDR